MFNSEKQFTNRASKISFEETFMNVDTPDLSFSPSTGYRFGYPSDWLSNPSQRKMIGLRSLKITPSSHTLDFYISVKNIGETVTYITKNIYWSITAENKLYEMLHILNSQLREPFTLDPDPTPESPTYYISFEYQYDPKTGKLEMRAFLVDPSNNKTDCKFEFFDINVASENLEDFAKFLNQQDLTAAVDILEASTATKTFYNVWDRNTLFFHASFSGSRRHLIGRNNDFWPTPSKKYDFRDSTNDFYVSFSTDGLNKLFPYYCNFYLELTFILNYDRSLN
jgi:hypothetical protein